MLQIILSFLLGFNPVESAPANLKDMQAYGGPDSTWVNMATLSKDFIMDIRYATTNNFMEKKIYDCGECWLKREVAMALLKAQKEMKPKGYRFKFFDCYRPRPYQQRLWDVVPDQRYVAPPAKGSMHSRGVAVDLTLCDSNGKELNMGTKFDFFGKEAYPTYTNLPKDVLHNRAALKGAMEKAGFRVAKTEWWHYSYTKKTYPLADWVWKCK